jgi:hypothetical protein
LRGHLESYEWMEDGWPPAPATAQECMSAWLLGSTTCSILTAPNGTSDNVRPRSEATAATHSCEPPRVAGGSIHPPLPEGRDISKLGGSIIFLRIVEVAGRPESSPTARGEDNERAWRGSISILRCSLDARSWSSNRPPFLPVLQMPMGREGNKQVWTKHHISNSPLEVAGATPVSQLPNEEKWARKALSEHYSIAPHSLEGLWIMRHDGLGIGDNFFGTVSMVCLAPLRSNHT